MDKKYLVLLFLFIFTVGTLSSYSTSNNTNHSLSIREYIAKQIGIAKDVLSELESLRSSILPSLKKSSYLNDSSLKIFNDKGDGFYFNFGYKNHGDITKPLRGLHGKLEVKKAPKWLIPVIMDNLSKTPLGFMVNVSPSDEFLLKVGMLFNDIRNKKLHLKVALIELFFMFYRLTIDSKASSLEELLPNKNLIDFLNKMKIGDKSLYEFLNEAWADFKKIIHYDFKIRENSSKKTNNYELIDGDNKKEIFIVASAGILKISLEYYKYKDLYLKTDKGRDLYEKLTSVKNKNEKLKLEIEFNQTIPEYDRFISESTQIIKNFLFRIKGLTHKIADLKKYLDPILSPFLEPLGLSFGTIIDSLVTVNSIDEESDKDQEQLNELFNMSSEDANIYLESWDNQFTI